MVDVFKPIEIQWATRLGNAQIGQRIPRTVWLLHSVRFWREETRIKEVNQNGRIEELVS